jgi:UDP-N-acetylglucosamine 2-epimerase (non-hydrolysing)
MTIKKITLVVGARPNFMKIAPIIREIKKSKDCLSYRLVHTGQHKNKEMSKVFFQDLGIPDPDVYLEASGITHAEQVAATMVEFEKDCLTYQPDMVLVVGDVNSTLACAIAAKKLNIKLAHVEAGLRSGDRDMPEEINRLIVDSISDLLFATEPSGVENLLREGHSAKSIHYVGNVMIDNLFYQNKKLNMDINHKFSSTLLKERLKKYAVLTLHRPSNVDNKKTLEGIVTAINKISDDLPIIFPVHPRTMSSIKMFNIKLGVNIHIVKPMPYLEFLNIWKNSEVVLTDSGGLQEETSALGVNCITIRNNTERPITIQEGTNVLSGVNCIDIINAFQRCGKHKIKSIKYWDGASAVRIINILKKE